MFIRKLLIASTIALWTVAAAHAQDPRATLHAVDGNVMVNKGDQFRSAAVGTPLDEGDRVMAMDLSEAVVRFSDNCEVRVAANTIATVPDGSPCDGVAMLTQSASPGMAVGAPVAQTESRRRALWWWLGGALAAAVIYDQVIRDDDEEVPPPPVSP